MLKYSTVDRPELVETLELTEAFWGPAELEDGPTAHTTLSSLLRVLRHACCWTRQPDIVKQILLRAEEYRTSVTVLAPDDQQPQQRWNIKQYSLKKGHMTPNLEVQDSCNKCMPTNLHQALQSYLQPVTGTVEYQLVISHLNSYLEHDVGSPKRQNATYEVRALRQQPDIQQQQQQQQQQTDEQAEVADQHQHVSHPAPAAATAAACSDQNMPDQQPSQGTPAWPPGWPAGWPSEGQDDTEDAGSESAMEMSDVHSETPASTSPGSSSPQSNNKTQPVDPQVLMITHGHFVEPPPILVLHLDRAKDDEELDERLYLKHAVEYPEYLDLTPIGFSSTVGSSKQLSSGDGQGSDNRSHSAGQPGAADRLPGVMQ